MPSFTFIRNTGLFALLLLMCNTTLASEGFLQLQKQYIDSVKQQIPVPPLSQEKTLNLFHIITVSYALYDMDSTIVWGNKTRILAEKLNKKQVLADLYRHMGAAYCFKGNYDSAFIQFNKAKEMAIKLKDKGQETDAISLIAFAYAIQGKYVTAMDYYLKILPMYEEMGRIDGCVKVFANLSEINRKLNNSAMAIQYLKRAEEKCNAFKTSPQGKGSRYEARIRQIYNEYAANYLENGDLEQARKYALKADSNNINAIIDKCYSECLLAKISLQQKDYNQALQYTKEAIKHADILKDKTLDINARKVLSDIYIAQGRYSEAEIEAFKAWQADSTNIDESRLIAANIALANIYMQNTEKAVYYLNKYMELNNLYSEKSFQTTVSDMTMKYETDKKEMRIQALERHKILSLAIGCTGVLLSLALWTIFRQKIKNERQEKQLAASNALLEGEKEERRRLARDLHDGLGGMLSAMKLGLTDSIRLQDVREKLDYCIEELGRMAHHLMPASLARFGMKAALEDYCRSFPNVQFYFFGEDKRINEQIELVVYYCAYELVNNSFKHSGAQNVNVQLIQNDDHVSLTVQDNGCGFDKTSTAPGAGLKNIGERVAAFNGKMDITTSPGKGTETNIELKIGT